MKIILFVIAHWYYSMDTTTIEFSSLEACEKARPIVEQTIQKLGDLDYDGGYTYKIRSKCVEMPK